MFSPSQNGAEGATSTNSAPTTRSRRRQRPASSESISQQPKAKRQRVPLSEQTFVNPEAGPEMYEVKATRPSTLELVQDGIETPNTAKKELIFRSKKAKPGDRLNKGDGSVVLTSNNAFNVSKLPALPDRLRADSTIRQHGLIDPSSGYALCLSQTHAVVWPYSATTPSPEAFTFELPHPSKHASDPLPLGALVSPSASSSEPGLIVVIPTSGKVTYWESISSATTLDFMRQQRNGVEDSISGMYASETVTRLVSAETSAGFVLAFSTGRVAYLSVRDAHGRPQISAQFLRASPAPSGGGIFGSLRHVLSHNSMQGDIAAVRADRSSRQGEATVVAVTSKCKIHTWRIHRGGHHDVLVDLNLRELLVKALQDADSVSANHNIEAFRVHDFTFVPRDVDDKYADLSQLRQNASPELLHLLLLGSFTDGRSSRYVLVEVLVPYDASQEVDVTIGAIRPVSSYSVPPDVHALAGPRVFLARPCVVAFLVFGRATVLASMARLPESPDSQLMQDSHILPSTYEDVIDLRDDPTVEIIGSGVEEPQAYASEENRSHRIKAKNPSAVLLVRGTGTLRVTTTDVERFASEKPPRITAKSKLEQAVFFGVKENNPLVFDVPRDLQFSDAEYGAAAVELSNDILSSSSPHLTALASHVQNNFVIRANLLKKLISHLRSLKKLNLSRKTKWTLLWDAEKLHTARWVWQLHEKYLVSRPADAKKDLIAEIVEFISDRDKSKPDVEKGQVDKLRHWLVHDTSSMEVFLAWPYQVLKMSHSVLPDHATLTRLIFESVDLVNGAVREAMAYRYKSLDLYGLHDEKMTNGIIADDYRGLDMPWTSTVLITNNLKRLVELASEYTDEHRKPTPSNKKEAGEIDAIRDLLPCITGVYLTALQELTRWGLGGDSPEQLELGHKWKEIYEVDHHNKVVQLALSENWDAATELAVAHRSLPALAEVLIKEIQYRRTGLDAGGLSNKDIERYQKRIKTRDDQIIAAFAKYGQEFAFPFYETLLEILGIDALLEYPGDKIYKTSFLRTRPELARVSWINDVIGEEDIVHAADTLLNLGLAREQQVWNKKIELSLGKLARMAEASRPSSKASFSAQEAAAQEAVAETSVEEIDKELSIIQIQEQVYNLLQSLLVNAVDDTAAVALAMEEVSMKIPKKYKILNDVFENSIDRLLKHEALDPLTLIDLLTLLHLRQELKEQLPDQFFLAIQVANFGLHGEERAQAERLIWRRCYLREEWTKINNTVLKGDDDIQNVLATTDLFSICCVLYAHQQDAANSTTYRLVTPSEASRVFTADLDRRFENSDQGDRDKLLEAMRWEDKNLQTHIDKHRLDEWALECQQLARIAVDQSLDERTAAGASNAPGKSHELSNGNTKAKTKNGIH